MPSQSILLTTPARVKSLTAFGGTIDDELLYPIILTAQEKYIHPTLGGDLYFKIQDLISADTIDDVANAAYKTVLTEYILPALVQYTFAEGVPLLRLRFAHNAVTTMASEQSTAASADDIRPIVESAMTIGNWYRERLIDYLCHVTNLPEYNTTTAPNVTPSIQNYTQGLNIDTVPMNDNQKALRQLLDVRK